MVERRVRTRWIFMRRSVTTNPRPRPSAVIDPAVDNIPCTDSITSLESRFVPSITTVTTSVGRTSPTFSVPRRIRIGIDGSCLNGTNRRFLPSSKSITPLSARI